MLGTISSAEGGEGVDTRGRDCAVTALAAMEGGGGGGGGGEAAASVHPQPPYKLRATPLRSEDILFCVDVGAESRAGMKPRADGGRGATRMDAIIQALCLFVHSKNTINPDHRFAFAVLGRSFYWLRSEFTNDVESATAAIRSLATADPPSGDADLTQLFQVAYLEAKKSRGLGRMLRVILIYCRSSTQPQHQYPINQKTFTMDVLYIHDKVTPENNVQNVFNALVDALEHVSEHEGYILATGHGILRVLFRSIAVLLSHPEQRCLQEFLDIPKPLTRMLPGTMDAVRTDENMPSSSG